MYIHVTSPYVTNGVRSGIVPFACHRKHTLVISHGSSPSSNRCGIFSPLLKASYPRLQVHQTCHSSNSPFLVAPLPQRYLCPASHRPSLLQPLAGAQFSSFSQAVISTASHRLLLLQPLTALCHITLQLSTYVITYQNSTRIYSLIFLSLAIR